IDEIVMSAFTSARNRDGELVDQYLYSIRYTRDIFEQCDLRKLDDLFEFILRFPNRINMAKNYSFRSIKPYETKIVVRTNELIEEAVLGLKELGYKKNDIEAVLPKLSEYQYESSGEYLKQALRLMKE
ncbi:MAG: RuvA C-terminal domain-containing protein, partial [Erysipelotrichaceae bacterium]|nr:RuvA C-terminal domain-containing protein [Erysipelotrichaceae bacterium]